MRRLEFRAWDKVSKKYLYPWPNSGFDILGETTCFDLIGQQIHEAGRHNGMEWLNEIDIEQFTGLHDKYGREIYEGDIAQFGSKRIGPILFKDGGFGYSLWGDFIGFAGHNHLKEVMEGIIIIGNVHENPELLKQ